MDFINTAFAAGYEAGCKIATVPTAVKMYRRALAGFEQASRSIPKDNPTAVPTAGFALHGSGAVPEILSPIETDAGKTLSARIQGSPIGETGQHGSGAYFWRGFPAEGYLRHDGAEGIVTDLKSLPNQRPMQRNIFGEHFNRNSVVSGPGDYVLRPKDTAVVDIPARTAEGVMPEIRQNLQNARMRLSDSAIFNTARKRIMAINGDRFKAQSKLAPGPSKTDVIKMLKR